MLLTGLAVPAAPARAAAALPSDLDIVLTGGGWGHGHGMSQYGARAQADAGRSWRQILHTYYSGVNITDEGSHSIRVLLLSAGSFVVGGPEHVTAKWTDGRTILGNTSTYPYFRVRAVSEGLAIDKGESASGPWRGITVGGRNIRFYPDGSVVPVATGGQLKYYRGFIEANRRSSSTVYAINQLSLEHYLRGVVPRESPSWWPANALRAQAVAARSYTLWKKANAGSVYHICATTQCQVYGGYGYRNSHGGSMTVLEQSSTNSAIADTSRQAMTVGGDAIFAEYHSTSGGHTSQGSRPYLAPVSDPWDKTYSPYHRWSVSLAVGTIEKRWPALGRLSGISDVTRDGDGPWGGRVESMTLVGTESNVTVSGNTFRIAMGLRSTLFAIAVYDSQFVSASQEVILSPGRTATASVVLKNTGNKSWPVGSSIKLLTWDPKDRASIFKHPSWTSSTRPSYVDADLSDGNGSVAPGQLGRFTFTIAAPSTASSGLYLERFRPVVSGVTLFGRAFTIPVRVRFGGSPHLGANLVRNASFESHTAGLPAGWERAAGTTADVVTTATAVDGTRSLRLVGEAGSDKTFSQTLNVAGGTGDRFVLTAWNRGHELSSTGGAVDLLATMKHTDGTTSSFSLEFPRSTHRWAYDGTAFAAPKPFGSIELRANLRNQTGATWYDRIRLARDDALNGSFESGATTPNYWTLVNAPSGSGRDRVAARAGEASLRLRGNSGAGVYARQYRSLAGRAGDLFRLSGWNRTVGSSTSGGAVQLRARVVHTDDTTAWYTHEFPRAAHAWRYGEIVFATAKAYDRVDVFTEFVEQTGTAWFDEIALAPAGGARPLSANGGFDLGAPLPGEWSYVNGGAGFAASTTAVAGGASLGIDGARGVHRYARQQVPVAGGAGDAYRLSGWNKTGSTSSTGGPIRIWARVVHADGSSAVHELSFSRAAHDWTSKAMTFTVGEPYSRIDLYVSIQDQTGRALFDSVRLDLA